MPIFEGSWPLDESTITSEIQTTLILFDDVRISDDKQNKKIPQNKSNNEQVHEKNVESLNSS